MHTRLFATLIIFTLLLSIPSLMRIPMLMPFLDANVRAAAPVMMEQLREKGLWLVNVDLIRIEQHDDEMCFLWVHRYRSGYGTRDPENIQTCVDA